MTPELSRCDVFTCTSRRIAPRISAQQPIVKSPPNAYGRFSCQETTYRSFTQANLRLKP